MSQPRWDDRTPAVPAATPEDVLEQQAEGADGGLPAESVPDDAPAADALEQAVPVGPGEVRLDRNPPLEAEGADVAEQSVAVELDEDEYR